jgi:hypothetical protein
MFHKVDWIACNLEYDQSKWSVVRERAAAHNIKIIPWIRLCNINAGDNWATIKDRLSLLRDVALLWGSDTILPNYENESDMYQPHLLHAWLYDFLGWQGFTGWSTQAWLPNDTNYRLFCEHGDSVLLQIFPEDLRWDPADIPEKLGDCVAHAREKGFTYVGVTYQSYRTSPEWFDCGAFCHSTFTGNTILEGEWGKWYP